RRCAQGVARERRRGHARSPARGAARGAGRRQQPVRQGAAVRCPGGPVPVARALMMAKTPPPALDRAVTATTSARAGAVFVVTALGTFMASLDLSIVNVAFPDIEASYPHASSAALSWIITAYSIVFGALL